MSKTEKAKSIFLDTLERKSASERQEYIVGACGSDLKLLREVESLLANFTEDDLGQEFQAAYGIDSIVSSSPEKTPREKIGRYTLLEQIGEGGMGIVWVAEQTQPIYRKVALKIIKPGMDTKEVIARFEAERQALAFMEHPNIARVLDAGATMNGRSYFIMELVRGIPITEYCDKMKLAPSARLELFQSVCDAVQHAHQKGVIHRDIKPSNVLVTQVNGKAMVKVIDFGLAKAVSGQRLTEKTVYTGFMKLVGTPAYMSPEQAGLSGLDVDTRSDVYSLGILLYELLVGTTPLDTTKFREQSYDEVFRRIRETDTDKPSVRFSTLNVGDQSTIAKLRQIEPHDFGQLLAGDLDRVVLKAIEKDRDQRYGSAQEFASDIERFLEGKPVLAVPPSLWYLTRKYIRRHKAVFLTASAVLLCLLLATALSTWQAFRLAKANQTATVERNAARDATADAIKSRDVANAAKQNALSAEQRAKQVARNERRLRYATNMQLADHLWHSDDAVPQKIESLLAAWIPTDDQTEDLRELSWRFQWSRLHLAAEKTFDGVTKVAFTANGNLVVAEKSEIRKWDQSTESLTTCWQGKQNQEVAALSDCGRWAAIRDESVIQFIEVASGASVGEIAGTEARFASDGNIALVWRNDKKHRKSVEHRLWNIKKKASHPLKNIEPIGSRSGYEWAGALSPDGHSYAFQCQHGNGVKLYLAGLSDPYCWLGDGVSNMAWSPDGQLLAIGRGIGDVVIRRIDDPESAFRFNTVRHVQSLVFSKDSKQLVVGGTGTVDFYNVANLYEAMSDGKASQAADVTPKRVRVLHAHIHDVREIAFSPDGLWIATVDRHGLAKLWNADTWTNACPLVTPTDFSNDGIPGINVEDVEDKVRVSHVEPFCKANGKIAVGDQIVSISESDGGDVLDIAGGVRAPDVELALRGEPGSRVNVTLATESPEEHRTVQLVRQKEEVVSKKSFSAFTMALTENREEIIVGSEYGAYRRNLQGEIVRYYPSKAPWDVETSPDRKVLASVVSKELILWDLANDVEFRRIPARVEDPPAPFDQAYIHGIVNFSPDGKFMAVGTGVPINSSPKRRSNLMVWDTATYSEIGDPFLKNVGGISSISFSPNSDHMVVVDHRGVLRVWSTSDWKLLTTFKGRENSLATSVSPDGRFLAQGGYSGFDVWDFAERKMLMTSGGLVNDLEFSDDGTLVIVGEDRVSMWDIQTQTELAAIRMGQEVLTDCEFAPGNEKLFVLGRRDGLWSYDIPAMDDIDQHPFTIAALMRRAHSQQSGGLTAESEKTFRHVLRLQKAALFPGHSDLIATRGALIHTLQKQGKYPSITKHPQTTKAVMGEDVTLKVECSHPDTVEWTYQWYFRDELIHNATQSSLRIEDVKTSDFGAYFVEATCEWDDDLGTIAYRSEVAFLVDDKSSVARGGFKKELFFEIKGERLADLYGSQKYPHDPDVTAATQGLELTKQYADCGCRLTGFIIPPKTGNYRFYLLSNDRGELFLSSDETPENKRPIAQTFGLSKTKARCWEDVLPNDTSKPILLDAGKRYWVEVNFRANVSDYFAVGWQMPDQSPPRNGDPPIPAEYLEFQLDE